METPKGADKYESREVEWLWRERIPRGLITIIGGKPDQGKGLICCRITADVTNEIFRDSVTGKGRHGNVLYSALEDPPELMTRPRLEAAGARLKNVQIGSYVLPDELDELYDLIRTKKLDLCIFDPFNAHLGTGVNRRSDSIRKLTNPLKNIAEETNCAIILVEHQLKNVSKNAHPLAAIGGSSSGAVAAARMCFLLGKNPADGQTRMLAPAKHNICEKPVALGFEVDVEPIIIKTAEGKEVMRDTPYLLFDGEDPGFDAQMLLGNPDSENTGTTRMGRPPSKRAEAAEWLSKYLYEAEVNGLPRLNLKPGPVKASLVLEDAKQFGISGRTLKRASVEMEIEAEPKTGGRNCTWALPRALYAEMNGDDLDAVEDEEKPELKLTDADIDQLLGSDDGTLS